MPNHDSVRRIAARLPGAIEGEERFGFSVMVKGKAKGFLWAWAERVHPKKPRVVNPGVLAIVVPHLGVKEMWLNSGAPGLFTEPHYDGYPAVLVRLDQVAPDVLEDLVIEAWRCKAPKDAVKAFDDASSPGAQ